MLDRAAGMGNRWEGGFGPRRLLRLCLAILPVCALSAQSRAESVQPQAPPIFQILDGDSGLPSSHIQTLVEDDQGVLWIGTANGLARYDGHSLRRYRARPDQNHALRGNWVEVLARDRRGQLWVATQGGYLARYRAESDDFETLDLALRSTHQQLEIYAMAASERGLWLGTYGAGLIEIDYDGRQLRRLGPEQGLPDPHLSELAVAADNSLWLLTLAGDLLHFDPHRETLRIANPSERRARVYGLTMTGEGPLVSTRDGDLCRLTAEKFVCSALPGLALPGRARTLLPGSDGDWIGGLGELLQRQDQRWWHNGHRPGVQGGLPNHAFWVGLRDRDDGVWLGTVGGGLLHRPRHAAAFSAWQPEAAANAGLRDGRVRGVMRDRHGAVWIGTMNAGLYRLDPDSGAIHPAGPESLSRARVWSLLEASDDRLWVAHENGVLLLQWREGALHPLAALDSEDLVGPMIDLLAYASDGRVLAASMGAGLNLIDPDDLSVQTLAFGAESLQGTELQMLAPGSDGRTWIASDRGLYALNLDCVCVEVLLADARVDAFALAAGKGVYALVDGRLTLFEWRNGLFRVPEFAPRVLEELQSVGGMAWSVGALWLAGPQGLFRYLPDADRLEEFDKRDGLPTREFSDRPFLLDGDGLLWLGSEVGLVRVDPAALPRTARAPRLRVDSVQAHSADETHTLDASGPLQFDANVRDWRVTLRLDTLVRPHAQRFALFLQGWDESWPEPQASPERVFGTVKPGRYQLQVRAWDGFGQAAQAPAPLSVVVLAPWWNRPLAWLIYALLAVLGLALLTALQRRRNEVLYSLDQARERAAFAQRLSAEKGALVAELSHEIRNPLNGLLGMGRLLRDSGLNPRQRELLRMLEEAGERLRKLLDDVLDWSRLESGRGELLLQPTEVAELLQPLLRRYREQAGARGLSFSAHCAPGSVVLAEPARVTQIVENLLANALKFTPAGGIEVRIESADGEQICVEVCDSGPGLAELDIERLFQPFERGSGGQEAPGTGLGLAISLSLAQRMGGSLRAHNRPSGGACLRLLLPRSDAPIVAQVSGRAEPDSGRIREGLRVLVVEDDPIGRSALEQHLRSWNLDVRAAADGLSALLLLQQHRIDVILLDWDLPGISGPDLARTLQGNPDCPHLIAVTGRNTPADLDLSKQLGFAAHLSKPLDWDRLARVLGAF